MAHAGIILFKIKYTCLYCSISRRYFYTIIANRHFGYNPTQFGNFNLYFLNELWR